MIRHILLFCATLGIAGVCAQSAETGNPLLRNCDAMTNLSTVEFVYSSPTSATVKCVEQTTILNRSGNGKGDFSCYVDPTFSLKSFAGTISDAHGKVIRKLKRTELKYTELSSSMAHDAATYYLECLSPTYPYTVRIEYEMTMKNGILGFPSFTPITSTGTALEKGVYTVNVPQGMQFGYKCRSVGEPVRSSAPGRDIYTWTLENIPAVKSEVAAPPLLDRIPQVLTAPGDFEYEGTQGSMRDWASFGKWMCGLLEGRGTLPEALKQEVHQRTDTISTVRGKIKALYDYMGATTRYVSIQLGIGGQQPMKVEEVYRTKFGDCKALSNYLRAMLAECGIPSDYVIIHTNRRRMHRDFASPAQANHAILSVPLEKDTLWLECTNTEVPFGYVHDNIAGHDAIVFRNGTGEFVTLPQYADTVNLMVSNADITLAEDGSAEGRVSIRYEAAQYDPMMWFTKLDAKKQNDNLMEDLKIPMARIDSIVCREDKSPVPKIEISYDLTAERYFNITGSRCFVPLSPFLDYSPNKDKERFSDIYFPYGYLDIVVVKLRLPAAMQVESLPKPCNVDVPFGTYALTATAEDGIITVEQRTSRRQGTYSREMFDQYRTFMTDRAKAFNANIVLKKL